MSERRDIATLNKQELVEMLQRQEKLLKNGHFLRSLPDKGQKIHDLVKRLKEKIAQREQGEDLTARFHKISISQSRNPKQDVQLDSDDDDDNHDEDMSESTIVKDISESKSESKCSASSTKHSKKTDKWAYDSAVTYTRKPKFEKSQVIPIEESIKIQLEQKNEYEALRAKQAAERLMQHKSDNTSYSSLTFTSQEAKDRYRDSVEEDEMQEDEDHSESDIQEQEETDED